MCVMLRLLPSKSLMLYLFVDSQRSPRTNCVAGNLRSYCWYRWDEGYAVSFPFIDYSNLIFAPGYGPLIRTYVQFLLAKLRFHRLRPEFNGLFEYEEYITLKGIDDPNEGYAVTSNSSLERTSKACA